jgi:opacity protein-like surface antigen
MYRRRPPHTFGPAVTSAATSVGPGRISKLPTGVAGGGQIGCDYQWNAWVFGFRDMLHATSLSSSRAFADTGTHWFDTLTARGGYLVTPQVLLYVQGGAAWTNAKVTFFDVTVAQVGEISNDRTGWTVGGGAEMDVRAPLVSVCRL